MDNINHPKHYKSLGAKCSTCNNPIECIDVTQHQGFVIGNAIKYLWRADYKGNKLEDLRKAAWYVNRAIENEQSKLNNQDNVAVDPTETDYTVYSCAHDLKVSYEELLDFIKKDENKKHKIIFVDDAK